MRTRQLLAGVAVAALAMTACGSDPGSDGEEGSDSAATSESSEAATTATTGETSADDGTAAPAPQGEPYRILVTGGIGASGVLADNSQTSVLAAQAGAAKVNEAGGVAGRPVEVTVVDDGGDPTVAVTRLREAIQSDTPPDLYLNSGPSTIAAATLPILGQNNILSMSIGPTEDSSDPSSFPLNFDLASSPVDQTQSIVQYMLDQGHESVGVIHGSTSFGVAFAEQFEPVASDAGLEVVGSEEYDVAALDMTPQLQALQAADPDVLLMDAYGGPLGYLLEGREKLGWDVPIVGNLSVAATSLISSPAPDGLLGTPQVDNLVMQVFHSTKYAADATDVNDAVAAMLELGEIPSTLITAYNFDAAPLVAAAAAAVGSADDSAALAQALETIEVQDAAQTVILPHYNFTTESHAPNAGHEAFVYIAPSELENGQFQ